MRIFDVNVLVLAHRVDQPGHRPAITFLEAATSSDRAFCVPPVVGSAVVRIATHPRIFAEPTPLPEVIGFLRGGQVASTRARKARTRSQTRAAAAGSWPGSSGSVNRWASPG